MSIQLSTETNNYTLEALIELVKTVGHECLPQDMTPSYLL